MGKGGERDTNGNEKEGKRKGKGREGKGKGTGTNNGQGFTSQTGLRCEALSFWGPAFFVPALRPLFRARSPARHVFGPPSRCCVVCLAKDVLFPICVHVEFKAVTVYVVLFCV